MRALRRPRGERVSLAAVLEEDLARSLRRVDTDAICHRSGEVSGEAMQRRKVRRGRIR